MLAVELTVITCWGAIFCTPADGATERQVLAGHVPAIARHQAPIRRFSSAKPLRLAIGLPWRNQAELTHLLQELYDPASPSYGRYLTPGEFTKRFGPTAQDYQAVSDFARTAGLRVTATHPNRVLLEVEGAVADIERTLHVTLQVYQHPDEARQFYAPDTEPTLDLAVPVLDISGLSDYPRPHPNYVVQPAARAALGAPQGGSGAGGTYFGKDFRAAYLPGVTLTGSGQSLALVQFDGYLASDITAYITQAGLPSVTLSNVLLDGFSGAPSGNGGELEVSLDIEVAIAMAPGLSKVIVYEGNPTRFIPNDVLNRIVSDNAAKQVSCSWNWTGGPSGTTDGIFQQMAAQGQSFFVASGDSDSFADGAVDGVSSYSYPAQSPYVTSVGGTVLTTTGPEGAYVSETVWNNRTWSSTRSCYVGSSGGISHHYAIPTWQQGVSMASNGGATTYRNFPDVALTASGIHVIAHGGVGYTIGGTSCATPLWAGFSAVVNQLRTLGGLAPAGFLNPAIYAAGKGTNYASSFHDTTTGDNTSPDLQNPNGSTTKFYAAAGYDLCSGWGSPAGSNLIQALAPVVPLSILPANGVTSSGPVGGPFSATSGEFVLTNLLTASLNWTMVNTSLWLDASPTSGTLAMGGPSISVTVALNTAAALLPAGIQNATLWFTNLTTGGTQSRLFTLQVAQNLVPNGGFETGSFTGWTRFGNTSSSSVSTSSTYVHSGSYGARMMPRSTLGYLSQAVPTGAGLAYRLSLWVRCDGQTPNEVQVSWNGAVLLDKVNLGNTGWTNLQFVVTATGTNAVLQLGLRDDRSYLGLDDVSVIPLGVPPAASFSANRTLGVAPLTVAFADASTGTITNRSWNFGDGATLNTNGTTATHTYAAAGSNTVSLTVAGAAGTNRLVLSNYIVVTSSPALLAVSPTNLDFGLVPVGLSSTQVCWVANLGGSVLTGTATTAPPFYVVGGSPLTLAPGESNAVQVAFDPAEPGTFNTDLIVTSDGGSLTNSVAGSAAAPPQPSFLAEPVVGVVPLDVVFTDTSVGTITNRIWDFGDGDTLTTNGTSVAHRYAAAGTNTVTLTTIGPIESRSFVSVGCVTVANVVLPGPLVVFPTVLDLGTALGGATAQGSFVVSNAGNADLVVTATLSDGPFDFVPDAATKLLLHMDETNPANLWPDSSVNPKLVTPNGGIQIDAAQFEFGGGSGLFNGRDGYLSVPASADWNFGAGDFTIDGWVKFNSLPAPGDFQTLVAQADGTNYASFSLYNFAGQLQWELSCYESSATVFDMTFDTSVATGTWYHVAMVRQSDTWSCYQDGVRVGEEAGDLDIFPDFDLPLLIGNRLDSGWLDGSLDELRISKGVARWTSDFVPPPRSYVTLATFSLSGQTALTIPIRFSLAGAGSFSNAVFFVSQGGNSTNTITAQATVPPIVLAPVYVSGEFSVMVSTVSRATYWLEFKDSLTETNWTSLPGVLGDGTTQILKDASAPLLQRFYRLGQH